MYFIPYFFTEVYDKRAADIICKHMNGNAICGFQMALMASGVEDAKNIYERRIAWENLYSYKFIPQELAFVSNKKKFIDEVISDLVSEEIIEPKDYQAFMVCRAVESLYEEKVEYFLDENNDLEDPIEENIYRIFDKDDRTYLISFFRNNLDKFVDYFEDLEGEELLTHIMSLVEDLSTYKETLCNILGDGDFLEIEAV